MVRWLGALVGLLVIASACGSTTDGGPQKGSAGASGADSAGASGTSSMSGASGAGASSGTGGAGAPGFSNIEQVTELFDGLVPGRGCLPFALPLDSLANLACKMFSAAPSATCDCSAAGRGPANADATSGLRAELASSEECDTPSTPACSTLCVCEVLEAAGASATDCLNNVTPAASTSGWCYVSPTEGIGLPSLISTCPTNQPRLIRFLGDAAPATGESFALACAGGHSVSVAVPATEPAPNGAPCVPSEELDPTFAGFNLGNISLDAGTPACSSGMCLVNHFDGRVSCPYGQGQGTAGCFVPGSDTAVEPQVVPQFVARPASTSVTCTCRCAGSGPGPYCTCPSGMQCTALIPDVGIAGEEAFSGSYCVAPSAIYDPNLSRAFCDSTEMNCGAARPD